MWDSFLNPTNGRLFKCGFECRGEQGERGGSGSAGNPHIAQPHLPLNNAPGRDTVRLGLSL